MSTAGAQGVKFDSSAVRPTTSPNTRLICSCRVVAPRKGCSQRLIVLILAPSLNVYGSVLAKGNFRQLMSVHIAVDRNTQQLCSLFRVRSHPAQIRSAFSTILPYLRHSLRRPRPSFLLP